MEVIIMNDDINIDDMYSLDEIMSEELDDEYDFWEE